MHIDRERAADLGVDAQRHRHRASPDGRRRRGGLAASATRDQRRLRRAAPPDRKGPQPTPSTIDQLYLPRNERRGWSQFAQPRDRSEPANSRRRGSTDSTASGTATVRAALAPGYALADRLEAIRNAADELNLPPATPPASAARGRELERTFGEFLWAFLLSVVFMYMILATQYESLVHPLTILLSLPLTVPFALLSLWSDRRNAEPLLGPRHPRAVRRGEEELDPADRPHEPACAHEGHGPLRRRSSRATATACGRS